MAPLSGCLSPHLDREYVAIRKDKPTGSRARTSIDPSTLSFSY
jgi:hypothetical protein